MTEKFDALGWCRFEVDPDVLRWVEAAKPVAKRLTRDPQHVKDWLRCGGTWFAGVNILPNDGQGAVAQGPPLGGAAVEFIIRRFGAQSWDAAQISVIYPGYPREMESESPAAFRFRRDRDAAHVDGLLPLGPDRRRHLQEAHGFVLGLALNATSPQASPLVVWEGSHLRMQAAFRAVLQDVPPARWSEVDLTDVYHDTRRACFAECRRVEVHAKPGQAYLVHRLALHGVAPWGQGGEGGVAPADEGRMIAYFRPELPDTGAWLD